MQDRLWPLLRCNAAQRSRLDNAGQAGVHGGGGREAGGRPGGGAAGGKGPSALGGPRADAYSEKVPLLNACQVTARG